MLLRFVPRMKTCSHILCLLFVVGISITNTSAFVLQRRATTAETTTETTTAETTTWTRTRPGYSLVRLQQQAKSNDHQKQEIEDLIIDAEPDASSSSSTSSSSSSLSMADSYLAQAKALRQEAASLQQSIKEEKEQAKQRQLARIDKWIRDTLLVTTTTNDNDDDSPASPEILYTVEQVAQLLQDKRMSEEHVMQMFKRLAESHAAKRSQCSPLVELLVQAAGKMDAVEREEQPNKRWSGKVERKLRRRLFANDWNIDLDQLEEHERNGGSND